MTAKFNKGDLVAVKAPWTRETDLDRLGFPRFDHNTGGFNTFVGIIINSNKKYDNHWQVQAMNGNLCWYEERHIKLLAKV